MPITQSEYTTVVRKASAYPQAILVEDFGNCCKTFIQTLCGYAADNVLRADSICSDDVNAPAYYNGNIGQMPAAFNDFQGPFFAGGIGGYPHTGSIAMFAWASHVQYVTNGALMLFSAPHIGITANGELGYMLRRGQGAALSNTCGAVGVAINRIVNPAAYGSASDSISAVPPLSTDVFPFAQGGVGGAGAGNNYQQYILNKILWDDTTTRTALVANYNTTLQSTSGIGARMKLATESIRTATSTQAKANLSAAFVTINPSLSNLVKDVFVVNCTFINVDDGYQAYIDIKNFEIYNTTTNAFADHTDDFKDHCNVPPAFFLAAQRIS